MDGIRKDPEKRREYQKTYYLAHKAEIKERHRDYYKKNCDRLKRASREQYRAKCMEQYNSEKG